MYLCLLKIVLVKSILIIRTSGLVGSSSICKMWYLHETESLCFLLHWIEFKLDFPFDKGKKKMNKLFVNWCLVTRDKLEILEYIISLILGSLMKMYLLTIFWIYCFQYILSYIFFPLFQSCFFQALFYFILFY